MNGREGGPEIVIDPRCPVEPGGHQWRMASDHAGTVQPVATQQHPIPLVSLAAAEVGVACALAVVLGYWFGGAFAVEP